MRLIDADRAKREIENVTNMAQLDWNYALCVKYFFAKMFSEEITPTVDVITPLHKAAEDAENSEVRKGIIQATEIIKRIIDGEISQ